MKGNLNSINGTLTGGIFQTATSGARVKIEGNDIILYDDTTGGSTPVTGNTASILFTRTDDKNGDFFIQKRASQNNDSGNVMEFFYNEIASDGYNYIFLGRKGDVSTTPSEWKTDILSVGVSGLIQMSIADRSDSSSIANFNVMTGEYYNDNIGAGTIGNPYLKTDALNINFIGAKGTIDPSGGGVTDTGGIMFSLLEKRGTLTNSKTLAIMDYDSGVAIEKLKMYSFGGTPSIELGGTAITSWNDVKTNLTSIGSNLVPSSNLTYDIGTSSYSWDEIFVRTLSNGGNIYMSLGGILTYISFFKKQ